MIFRDSVLGLRSTTRSGGTTVDVWRARERNGEERREEKTSKLPRGTISADRTYNSLLSEDNFHKWSSSLFSIPSLSSPL